jgi:hypothetical protein
MAQKKTRSNTKKTPAAKQAAKTKALRKRKNQLESISGPIARARLDVTWPSGTGKERQANRKKAVAKTSSLIKEKEDTKKKLESAKRKKTATKKKASSAQRARRKKK